MLMKIDENWLGLTTLKKNKVRNLFFKTSNILGLQTDHKYSDTVLY